MRLGTRISHLYSHLPLLLPLSSSCLRCNLSYSTASLKDCPQSHEECNGFLPWLQQKAGLEISSTLSVGSSVYGRSLFASKFIQAGESILRVPYSVQITPDNILPEIKSLICPDVGKISQLAVVLLAEQKLGQDSEWAPYINSLPHISEMHSTIFWSKDELEMVRQSSIYQETINHRASIEQEFSRVRPAFEHFPQNFGDLPLEHFMHAYALVVSRAWGTSKGLSLVPFADFLNHDGVSEAVLLSDGDKEISEVIADRSYAVGEQVLIRYGKFPNATLLLDFGFTLPYNTHDQVHVWMDVPSHDPLHLLKVELLHNHCNPTTVNAKGFNSSWSPFIIKEVKSVSGKGKGIPQALRAFARVLSATSPEELKALATEAAENDGRLARRPLENKATEIQAHRILLSQFTHMIHNHDAAIKLLGSLETPTTGRLGLRRKMARELLTGELQVLRSACAWLTNYCASLSAHAKGTC